MKTRYLLRYLLAALFLTAWCSNAGCGAGGSVPADAGAGAGSFDHPATGFGGPIAPQGGTITSITGTSGVTGSCAAGPCSLSADTTFVQKRVTGTCASGLAIGTVNADGTVSCNVAGVSGTGTTGDLSAWASSTSLGNYAGSTATGCGAGNATTNVAIGANGVLTNTCSTLAAIGAAAGTGTLNTIPRWSNTTGGLVDSTAKDDGTTFSIGANKVTITEANGNTSIVGTLGVSSITTVPKLVATGLAGNFNIVATFVSAAQTTSIGTISATNTGTYNTTSGALTSYGASVSNTATRSAGANNLTNIGVYVTTSGAQINNALQTDAGDVALNQTSGGTGIGGAVDSTTQLRVYATGAGLTSDRNTLWGTNAATYDTTAAQRGAYGAYVNVTATRSAGANNLIDTAIYANASGGQVNRALKTDAGDVLLNQISGHTGIGKAADASDQLSILGGWNVIDGSADAALRETTTLGVNYIESGTSTTGGTAAPLVISNMQDTVEWAHWDTNGDLYQNFYADTSGGTSGGVYNGQVKDIADILQVSNIRKNWSYNSDALGTDIGGSNNGWAHNNYVSGSTLAYTTSSQVSARGVTETVGQITCTDGTAACTTGGSDLRMIDTSASTGVADLRSLTATFSVWVKEASGTNANFTLMLARYNDADQVSTTCAVNSTTWTRCTLTATFTATSYTDNSEVRAYIQPRVATTAHYVYGAQLELLGHATPYQENDATLATARAITDYGAWVPILGVGNTDQHPTVSIDSTGITTGAINAGIITPSTTGTLNDWAPAGLSGAKYVLMNATATTTLNGIDSTGVAQGRELCLINTGAGTVTINYQNAGSLAANRITTSAHVSWRLLANSSEPICFVYNSTSQWQQSTTSSDMGSLVVGGFSATANGNWTGVTGTYTLGVVNGTGGNNTLTVHHPGAANTANQNSIIVDMTGSLNTTSGALTSYTINASNTATRSAGANNLTNVGIYSTVSGAQINTALQTDAGDVILNNTSGNTTIGLTGAQTLTINSAVQANSLITASGGITIGGTLIANNVQSLSIGSAGISLSAGTDILRLTCTGSPSNITSLSAGTNGQIVMIEDVSGVCQILDQTGWNTPGGVPVTMNVGDQITVQYDSTAASWQVMGNGTGLQTLPPTAASSATTAFTDLAVPDNVTVYEWNLTGGNSTLAGMGDVWDGRVVIITNQGNFTLTFQNNNTGETTVARRFELPTGNDYTIPSLGSATFVYNGSASRWHLIGAGTTQGLASGNIPKGTGNGNAFANSSISDDGTSVTITDTGLVLGSSTTTLHVKDLDTSQRPTLSGCGTSPSIVGNDAGGKITIGTGGATACVITFHTAYSSNVGCQPTRRQGAITSYSLTTTALTVNATFAASDILDYSCADH